MLSAGRRASIDVDVVVSKGNETTDVGEGTERIGGRTHSHNWGYQARGATSSRNCLNNPRNSSGAPSIPFDSTGTAV
jgi:hypothetical protein